VLRARVALAAGAGDGNEKIARDLDCSVKTVPGMGAAGSPSARSRIFDKPRSGRPGTHGPSARLAVVAVSTSLPPDGETAWSQAAIARPSFGERGPGHLPGRRRPCPRRGARPPHKVRGLAQPGRRPVLLGEGRGGLPLYLNPPPGTVLISIDEKTGIQAKSRTHPDIPGRAGGTRAREFEYVRHGTVSVVAALNVANGTSSPSGSGATTPSPS